MTTSTSHTTVPAQAQQQAPARLWPRFTWRLALESLALGTAVALAIFSAGNLIEGGHTLGGVLVLALVALVLLVPAVVMLYELLTDVAQARARRRKRGTR